MAVGRGLFLTRICTPDLFLGGSGYREREKHPVLFWKGGFKPNQDVVTAVEFAGPVLGFLTGAVPHGHPGAPERAPCTILIQWKGYGLHFPT